jgi:hypothetical protein
MGSDSNFTIVLVEGLDATQNKLIHEAVKENSEVWWHEFENTWIIKGGGDVAKWRDRLSVIVSLPGCQLLVMGLPTMGARSWAGRMAASRIEWLKENYNNYEAAPNELSFSDEPPF